MDTVMLQPLFHRGTECIGIFSPQNATLNYYFQRKAGAKWSRTHKCWYIPCTEKNYEQLTKALAGKATLQIDELKKYLLEKKYKGCQSAVTPARYTHCKETNTKTCNTKYKATC
jgi:integrase/recombinase XerD